MNLSHLVKDVGGLALYSVGPRVCPRVPRAVLASQARVLGDAVRHVSGDDARTMEEELLRTFRPDDLPASPSHLVQRAYHVRMAVELEVLRYGGYGPHNIDRIAVLDGEEHLRAALDRGQGAIVMLAHFGANQLVMPALGHRGYTMNQLSAPPTAWADIRVDERVNRVWEGVQRRRWAQEQLLPVQHIDVFGFLRPAYRALERNEVLGLAFDGGSGRRWIPTPLGQRTAWVAMQPWQLARSTGAAVVPTVVVWEPREARHRVVFGAPMHVGTSGSRRADVEDAAARYGAWFTDRVREHPDHYLLYLLLRRKVAASDDQPFFDDY